MRYLMANSSVGDPDRRELLSMAAALAGSSMAFLAQSAAAAALQRTPGQILGPLGFAARKRGVIGSERLISCFRARFWRRG